jgi:hypothetical protein
VHGRRRMISGFGGECPGGAGTRWPTAELLLRAPGLGLVEVIVAVIALVGVIATSFSR